MKERGGEFEVEGGKLIQKQEFKRKIIQKMKKRWKEEEKRV